MFYKNIIFVSPMFWYGIVSVYSNIMFYDTYLYNMYNLFFTSLPIMYFGVFDYEFSKEELLTVSKHYQLGFRSKTIFDFKLYLDKCFSKGVFWRWVFYAFWQGALVVFFGFYSMENVDNNTGWSRGLVVDG